MRLTALSGVLPAQRASSLRVVLVVVQPQQQLSQIRVYLMVPHTRKDFKQQGRLAPEALQYQRTTIKNKHTHLYIVQHQP